MTLSAMFPERLGVVGGVKRPFHARNRRVTDRVVHTRKAAHAAHEREQLRGGEVPVGRAGCLVTLRLLRLLEHRVEIAASGG